MSSPTTSSAINQIIDEQEIALYLANHTDFFQRHTNLLAGLDLPYDSAGGTVSLVERQMGVLRDKNRKLDRQMRELVTVAKANHELSEKIHQLALRMITANGLEEVIERVEASLRSDFGGSDSVVVLFHDPSDIIQSQDTRFLRHLPRNNPGLQPFATFLDQAQPRCGRARDAQLDFLFPDHSMEIGSMALIPLGEDARIGLMAVGSHDTDRFHPGMSTDFLERIGDLVSAALGMSSARG